MPSSFKLDRSKVCKGIATLKTESVFEKVLKGRGSLTLIPSENPVFLERMESV